MSELSLDIVHEHAVDATSEQVHQVTATYVHRRYVAVFALFFVLLLVTTFIINVLVDPLWYSSGNRFNGENFAFNERVSKVNHFLRDPEEIDCLIFGSSRATLLEPKQFDGYHCYNFAVSGGHVGEFVAYAEYLRDYVGLSPKLVIVGVDDFHFWVDDESLINVPEFVAAKSAPPALWRTYLSSDAIKFSLRTLAGRSPVDRYYDRDFSALPMQDAPLYNPSFRPDPHKRPISLDNVARFKELRAVFPDASYVAYAPPISAWKVAAMDPEYLDGYLHAMFAVSQVITPMYDFSMPSPLTIDPGNTYDGDHFYPAANELVADRLQGKVSAPGVRVDRLSSDEYRRQFYCALENFLSTHGDDSVLAVMSAAKTGCYAMQ